MSLETILNALLAFIGGGILWFANDVRSRVIRLEAKMDRKMDVEDHEKQAEQCVRTITDRFNDTWMGLKERFSRNEKCLMEHTHDDKTGKTIITVGL
jgi:hypothetical protein